MSLWPATLAEWEAWPEATEAERTLIEAARADQPCCLGDGSRPEAFAPDRHIRAPLIRLIATGGTPECGLPGTGVWLRGAWISVTLDLRHATSQGDLVLDFCTLVEVPRLVYARLTLLRLDDSALPGLFGQGAEWRGSLYLRRAVISGTVDLDGATVHGQLSFADATLDGKGGKALNAQGARLGNSLFLGAATVKGTVCVNGAHIVGQMHCSGSQLFGNGDKALSAQGLSLTDSLFLNDAVVMGNVYVTRAIISGNLVCENAILNGLGGEALSAHGTNLSASLSFKDATVTGSINLNGATIGGQFICDNAALLCNGPLALSAEGLRVDQSFFFRRLRAVTGGVLLGAAHVGNLVDDPASWAVIAGEVDLDGFTYDRIHSATDAPTRLAWLEKCAQWRGEVFPQPYTQLAKVLAGTGHSRSARQVLHRREQRLSEHRHKLDRMRLGQLDLEGKQSDPFAAQRARAEAGRLRIRMTATRLWALFLDRLIGFGFRPEFALAWAAGTFLLATLVYWVAYTTGGMVPNSAVVMISASWAEAMAQAPAAPALVWTSMAEGRHYESFAALPYALDVILPIVDLGQQSAWAPTTQTIPGTIAWVATWIFTLFGWMLSALLVAALTGLIQKNQPGTDQ
ncbi:hypothetical protein [Pararhodobacter aggregans]|nr:hypothetical protein [Pararhodobacter aggregans]PTX01914.1 hypothetical protein C8N33_106132 [Pararhodobacter aggregans]